MFIYQRELIFERIYFQIKLAIHTNFDNTRQLYCRRIYIIIQITQIQSIPQPVHFSNIQSNPLPLSNYHSLIQQPSTPNLLKTMRQKRQQFQKQIRRQAIQKIFKTHRQKHFNFKPNPNPLTLQTINQLKEQSQTQFNLYIQLIQDALKHQNQNLLYNSLKDSSYFLKKILIKAKDTPGCLQFIISNWFGSGFDQRLFESVAMFTAFANNQFSAARRQTYKYALHQFYLIFEYESLIQKQQFYQYDMFKFLFLVLAQLDNDPEMIMEIFVLVNSLVQESSQIRHEFFFINRFENDNSNPTKICFEYLTAAMFKNRQRMKAPNSQSQEKYFRELKMYFIDIFNIYCEELKALEKCITTCKKVGQSKPIPQNKKSAKQLRESTLKNSGYPEEIRLKKFMDKHYIVIIYETIKQMKQVSFNQLSQGPECEQNLATCLQAFRGLLQFYPSKRILAEFQNELQFLISKLSSNQIGVVIKNQIILLLDTIIYIDHNNELTDSLIRNHCLFQRVWSYNDKSVLKVKLNILNNIILSDAGFDVAMKYLSQIYITLYESPYVTLAQTFCINYFTRTKYDLHPTSRFDLVIDILENMPADQFKLEDFQRDLYIYSHLYNNRFPKPLPPRYEKWKKFLDCLALELHQDNKLMPKVFEDDAQQKIMLIDLMTNLQMDSIDISFINE